MSKKVLFLVPYPLNTSPSQRFRFELFFPIMKEAGIDFEVKAFLAPGQSLSVGETNLIKSIKLIVIGFFNRLLTLFNVPRFDFIFIHRETTPIGPPLMEWAIKFIFRKRIIYDFDDAIWTTDRIYEPAIVRILKWRNKVASICKWSYRISAGNEYIARFAAQYNDAVQVVPTVVDTISMHYPVHLQEKDFITIGWTGSSSTLKYLNEILTPLQQLEISHSNINFLIIADRNPELPLRRVSFLKWTEETEVADLRKIDIGIMPLPNDDWTKGKCGFKAIQYMALGIPAVVSPVGVNCQIIEDGVNGFFATTSQDWVDALKVLINDSARRSQMGKMSRKKIHQEFSLVANRSVFLTLFE
jgi:glycosyltransferase involved in cell wall biosynthesis